MTTVGIRLSDLGPSLTITRGFPTQRAAPEGDVRVMSVAMLRNDAAPRHFAERDDLADLGMQVAQPGDVLVAIEGATVGESLVVPPGIDEFVPSQQAATLRATDPAMLDPWYLGAWLSTDSAREQLRRLARGSGIQRIPLKDLGSLIVLVPPLEAQREIGGQFRAFEAAIQSHRAVIACLEELRGLDLVLTFASITTDETPEKEQT
jgi:hypothetical protein